MENTEPSRSQYNWIEQPIQKQAGGKRMSFWANRSLYVSAEMMEKYFGGQHLTVYSQTHEPNSKPWKWYALLHTAEVCFWCFQAV